MAKTYTGFFEQVIDFESLYMAYLKARKGKRKKRACRRFELDLEGNLIQLQNELIWGTYKTGGYRYFPVYEPKTRTVAALKEFRDRIVQQAVMAAIEPIWESRFISDSYACRVGKGTHAGADKAQEMMRECLREYGQLYALKADIRKYFASIKHHRIKALLRKRIADPRLLLLLDDIIDSYHEEGRPWEGLPIGNLTSQLFANIYLDALDQWFKCRKQERWYARYMDDFIVLSPSKSHLHALRIDAECWLADNLELETNEKTSVFPIAYKYGRGLDFLGYHLWPSGRRLRKTSLKRLKRRIRRLHKKYIAGLIGLAEAKEKLNSMIAHAKHGNAHQAISKALDQTAFRGLIA